MDSTINNTGSPITLDGTENTVVETAAGVTGHATTQAIADLGGGGGIVTAIADDTDITVSPFNGSTIVVYTALTATRIVTLPPAAGPDQIVLVKDFSGNASDVFLIGFAASGGDSVPDFAITRPFADLTFVSDGVSVWSFLISERTEVVAARVQAIEDELGGTDGDGNVYSIEYDPDLGQLSCRMVKLNGDVARFMVGAGQAALFYTPGAGGEFSFIVQNNGTFINNTQIELNGGNEGDVLTQQADGSFRPQAP